MAPFMSGDNPNEAMMQKHRLPGTPDTLHGHDYDDLIQPHSVANAADMAADHNSGRQYSSGTPTMRPASKATGSTGTPARRASGGGPNGTPGKMGPASGPSGLRTGSSPTRGSGGGFGSANITRGRGSSRR